MLLQFLHLVLVAIIRTRHLDLCWRQAVIVAGGYPLRAVPAPRRKQCAFDALL